MKDTDKIKAWLETLSKEQTMAAAEASIERLIEIEEVKINDANYGPFWDSNGESILEK